MESTNEDFPPRVAEKIGRKNFAEHIGAKKEKARYTKELEPYLEEVKRAAEKKSAAHWKKKMKLLPKFLKVCLQIQKTLKLCLLTWKRRGVSPRDRERGTMCGQMWMV